MHVTCEQCKAVFRLKSPLPAGRSGRFRCPKCGNTNLIAPEVAAPSSIPTDTVDQPPALEAAAPSSVLADTVDQLPALKAAEPVSITPRCDGSTVGAEGST